MISKLMRISLTLLLGLFLTGAIALNVRADAPEGASAGKTIVKLGMVGRPDIAANMLAIRRGYFAKQGIEIQPVLATSGQQFAAQLATNQIQVASGVPNAALFNALNRGIDIRIVADEAHIADASDRTVSIMVRSELIDSGAVKGPADLKGRRYAPGPVSGQYPDVLFHKLFAMGGFTEADATPVHLAFPDALAALASKQIDSAFLIEPLVRQAEDRKIARVLFTAGQIDPGAETSILQYSAAFAQQRETAIRFMVAYLEGARDYYDAIFLKKDRDAALDILVKDTPLKDRKIWEEDMFRHTDLNGHVNLADLKSQAAFYKEQGTLSGPIPDIAKYVDMSFAEAAIKRIGAR
jgi:NitT/TauT family transport system substrate-binding protein